IQNAQRHAAELKRASALLRPRLISAEIARGQEKSAALGKRLDRCFVTGLAQRRAALDAQARRLERVSYREAIAQADDKLRKLGAQLDRCYAAGLTRMRAELEAQDRMLESVSYRAVLERGFVLVKGDNGLKRRASEVKPVEGLTLTFADG